MYHEHCMKVRFWFLFLIMDTKLTSHPLFWLLCYFVLHNIPSIWNMETIYGLKHMIQQGKKGHSWCILDLISYVASVFKKSMWKYSKQCNNCTQANTKPTAVFSKSTALQLELGKIKLYCGFGAKWRAVLI